jgi:hypothetical protein
MRQMTIVLWGLAILVAGVLPMHAQDALESQLNSRLDQARSLSSVEVKPTEIVKGNVTYSGIAVAWLKTENWLQLVNPLAPAKYGSGEENILRDSSTGRVYGWKLLSIRF